MAGHYLLITLSHSLANAEWPTFSYEIFSANTCLPKNDPFTDVLHKLATPQTAFIVGKADWQIAIPL